MIPSICPEVKQIRDSGLILCGQTPIFRAEFIPQPVSEVSVRANL